MAIEKYVTRCLVLESYDQGEHDRAYKVFTREFGMLVCQAKSIRKIESKLRAHILPRSISLITLVEGKEVWRLVGAVEEVPSPLYVHEVSTLLKRFVRGGGSQKTLYDRVVAFMEAAHLYEEQTARLLLYYIVLVELGYADAKVIGIETIKEYSKETVDDLYTRLLLTKEDVRRHVQAVLKEMQM
jgi:recombinational DNA repair protein (RecF pathway)